MVMIKGTNGQDNWKVYHRDLGTGDNKMLALNTTDAAHGMNTSPNNNHFVSVTDTAVTFKSLTNTRSYVMYVFAGGDSNASEARSVEFDGNDHLSFSVDSDLDLGNSDFTFEAWFKPDTNNSNQYIFNTNNNGFQVYWTANKIIVYGYDGSSWFINGPQSPDSAKRGQWHHVAVTRSSNVFRCFLNGIVFYEATHSNTFVSLTVNPTIGRYSESNLYFFYGKISNLRLVKGTAVYTSSSFEPPTKPLKNITNTKLLCCNNSSVTGGTVLPNTPTANGNPTASSHSPFDDPAGFVFGDSKEGIIKTGSYVGNGDDADDIDVYLGWEPTWLLVKQTVNSGNWQLVDSATRWPVSGNWETLRPNLNQAANASTETGIQLTATGFKVVKNYGNFNTNGDTHVFMAIRRPDPAVQKPQLATDVFVPTLGNGSATIPSLPSTFPVDFCLYKDFATTANWATTARLTGGGYMQTNTNNAEASTNEHAWDSMVGCHAGTWLSSNDIGYLWKRNAGFDCIAYKGHWNSQPMTIKHSLNKIPEMAFIKRRTDSGYSWVVYHKGLNGGTNPHQYFMMLNSENAEASSTMLTSAPTSTSISLSGAAAINNAGKDYIMMLFASISGISKCGYYDGSDNDLPVNLGFSPRFVLIKAATRSDGWAVYDSTRGVGTGGSNDKFLRLNNNNAQIDVNHIDFTSTGFTLKGGGWNGVNDAGQKYVYYAHA
jgi:hypothetical protein